MAFKSGLGIQVDRAAVADPQNVWQTIFTIAGGLVWVKAIIGVRTIGQAGGASTMQFRHSVGPTVLDAGTLSVAAHAANAIYYLTGDPIDPIQAGVLGAPVAMAKIVATSVTQQGFGAIMFTGNIQVTMTAVAGTGSTRYILFYYPIDAGATIVAA